MRPMNRFRVPAVLCGLTFLICELVSRPFAEMGIADDWSYVWTVRTLAATGHIVYNGWATAMLGWQLYLAAGLVKIFGFSFSMTRVSTLLVGAATAFLIQRVFVRMGANERNATIGSLAVVLSPLYLLLSATLMTDIGGLFALVICLYGCLRAIQSFPGGSALAGADTPSATRAAIGWLCFAAASNVFFGSSRQIAWLGVLVLVPSTAWLLRRHRGLLAAGLVATLVGAAFVAWGMHWFKEQPYTLVEAAMVKVTSLHQVFYMVRQMSRELTNVPFFGLAIMIAFLPELRRGGVRFKAVLAAVGVAYLAVAIRETPRHGPGMMLVPMTGDWVGLQGFYGAFLGSPGPEVFGLGLRITLTALVLLSVLCVFAFARRVLSIRHHSTLLPAEGGRHRLAWGEFGVLVGPFTLAYLTLLLPRSLELLYDRYALPLILIAIVCLIRAYQDFVRPALPQATVFAVALIGLFGVSATHDMFAFDRARVQVADEMRAAGVPDTLLDGAFEYDGWVELEHAGHMNDPRIANPPNSFVAVDPHRGLSCVPGNTEYFSPALPDLTPAYGIAFRPDACRGAAAFAPVSYHRWLGLNTATLYVVKYGPR